MLKGTAAACLLLLVAIAGCGDDSAAPVATPLTDRQACARLGTASTLFDESADDDEDVPEDDPRSVAFLERLESVADRASREVSQATTRLVAALRAYDEVPRGEGQAAIDAAAEQVRFVCAGVT